MRGRGRVTLPAAVVTLPIAVVMVKAPIAGTVKTRLTPPVPPEDAARLALAFAQDVVSGLRQTCAVLIAYAPAQGRVLLEPSLPAGLAWTPQRGQDLGERLSAALLDASTRGFAPLLVVGTDSPTLPPAFAAEAVSVLQSGRADVVLGPTEDGGYYLVGVRSPIPGLFDNVAWSTPLAFAHTAANAARLGLRLHTLPFWYDIDTAADLLRLRRELGTDPAARLRAPAAARCLRSLAPVTAPADAHPQDAHPQTTA